MLNRSWFSLPTILIACWWGLCGLACAPMASAGPCSNDEFRTGASANLPDCRAYELMTPPDTSGRILEGIGTFGFTPPQEVFPTDLLSPSGDSLVYLSYGSGLANPDGGNGLIDVYEAGRTRDGWLTARRLSPSGAEAAIHPNPGGISADHQFAFSAVWPFPGEPGGSLAANGSASYLGKADGSFELIGRGELGEEQYAQGRYISVGGKHVIFTTGKMPSQSPMCSSEKSCPVKRLELDAPQAGTGAVYDREANGETRVVSLLPGDVMPPAGDQAFYLGVSKDGATVAFMINGTLYVRNPDQEDGETVEIAEGGPTYAGLSDEGRYLFYVVGGDSGIIHRFDIATEEDLDVNPGAEGEVVNVSADGSHVYFISKLKIAGEGIAGQPNLYVWSGGAIKYVATVALSDLERTSGTSIGECPSLCGIPALTRWTDYAVAPISEVERGPGAEASRTTPDGHALLFESRAKLTSFDNAGHTEVYLFDDAHVGVRCISCNTAQGVAQHDAQLRRTCDSSALEW